MHEIRIFFNNFDEQIEFLRKYEYKLRWSLGFHFFFEGNNEIRLRSQDDLVTYIEVECRANNIPFKRVSYKGEEYDFYGYSAWSKVKDYFNRVSLTGLDYHLNNFEKPKRFYTKRYVHLLMNHMGYGIGGEAMFYLKMFLRYAFVSCLLPFFNEDRLSQILKKVDILFWWQ